MPTFLQDANRGIVRRVQTTGTHGAIVSGDIPDHSISCLVNRVVVNTQGNYQFMHTLGNVIYTYVFGDRMGEIGVAGLSYFDCDSTQVHGITQLMAFYNQRRIAAAGEKIFVTVGSVNLRGYLTGMRIDSSQPEQALMEFYLTFALIPES